MPGSCCSRHGSHVAQEIQWTAGHVQWLRTTVQELDDRDLVRGTTRTETETAGALRIDPDSDGDVDDVGAAPSNASTSSPSPRPRSRPADQVDVPDSRDREGYTVWRNIPPSATGTKTANAASQRSQLSQHGRVVGATWQTRAHLGRSHDAEEPESPRPWLTPSSHDAGNDEGPEPLRFRAFVTEPPIRIELMTFSLRVRRSTD